MKGVCLIVRSFYFFKEFKNNKLKKNKTKLLWVRK